MGLPACLLSPHKRRHAFSGGTVSPLSRCVLGDCTVAVVDALLLFSFELLPAIRLPALAGNIISAVARLVKEAHATAVRFVQWRNVRENLTKSTHPSPVCGRNVPAPLLVALPVRADKPAQANQALRQQFVIPAQGHPKHMDFVARSSKRVDLRINVQRKGLDAAFTDWLREEHSHLYREYAANFARQAQVKASQAAEKVAPANG